MTTYTVINDPEIAPGAPGTSSLFTRLRDNVLAIIQGDVTAPKISNAALATVPGQNLHVWNTAGTYSLVIPAGITSIEVDATGGGGGMYPAVTRYIGGSAGERRLARVGVTPGETLIVVVGDGGATSSDGVATELKRGATVLVQAKPGRWSASTVAPVPGGTGGIGGTGFDGGTGGWNEDGVAKRQQGAPHGGNTASNGAGGFRDFSTSVPSRPGLVIIRY